MKKLIIKYRILSAILSTCIVLSAVAIITIKPWKNNAAPTSAQKENTVQADKDNNEDVSDPSSNTGQTNDTDEVNDTGSMDDTDGSNNTGQSKDVDQLNDAGRTPDAGRTNNTAQSDDTGGTKDTDQSDDTGGTKDTDRTDDTGGTKDTDRTDDAGGTKDTVQTDDTGDTKDTDQTDDPGENINTGQTNGSGGSNNSGTVNNGVPLSSLLFTIRFETNGGTAIPEKQLPGLTKLESLPSPYKADAIFMGWYYDSDLTNRVAENDGIRNDLILYAKYGDSASLQETETPHFASALDQPTNISFIVLAPGGCTAAQVKAGLTAKDITTPEQTDFIEVTGGDGRFTVSASGGEFDDGATYKITLDDESLTFEGFDASVRDYNFTTAKAEVLNLALNDSVIYIAAEDVSDMTVDGNGVASLSIPLATTDLGTIDYKSGTFTYEKAALAVSNNVAIYKGVRPDLRDINDDSGEGEVAYITITAVNGTTYSYKNAEAEDIIFTPDVLPVKNISDQDGNNNNYSVTIAKSVMDFSDEVYKNVGLDEQTTIDVGDYIAFYSGEFGAPSGSAVYGCITGVQEEGDNYIITYKDATIDEVIAAMDVYDTEGVDGETLIEGVNKEDLEEDIEQQALDSGFVDESAKYLAALTLDTDEFTKLDGDFDLESYNIVLDDGTPLTKDQVQLMDGKKVEVEVSELKATITTNLKHFEGLSGLRCTLKVGIEIKINTGEESQIVIGVTGYFEQEVRISVNCSGGAVWKWFGIFPYIAEYQLNANVDLYEYTGISIEATIATKEKDEEWDWDKTNAGQNLAKQLKELLDAKDKYVGDGEDTVTDGLCDKYKAMLENESDWVELFSKEIFSSQGQVDPFHILVYEIDLKFVVTANMNISIGCDFYYENAKRYNYSIGVFKKTCNNETIDLVEEHYEFTFYVMGTMGIRAGVKFEIKAGLISTKLDSVGISAEAGAYIRVWGYFYYELSYTASKGKQSKYSGALLFELGIYLEIKFEAQAFGGAFSYNPTLYENEWPLWSAGSRENVQAFAQLEDDDPKVALKKHLNTSVLPDDYFKMTYLDLKTGEVEEKSYDDEKCFQIEITNSAFSYNTGSNILKLVQDGEQAEDGEMVITWINAPLAFTSEPIQRTINLHWDNYNDGYAIVFNSNGGSAVPMIIKSYTAAITAPENPTKTGYDFGGWYSDAALTIPYTVPSNMPARDVEVFAKWKPRSDTKYKVEHYQQNLKNNLYTLTDTDILQGKTDSKVTPATKTYEGFQTPAKYELTILPDGSALMKYYYSRNSYSLTFEQNSDNGQSDWVYNLKYGASVTVPKPSAAGYQFAGWNTAIADVMPANSLVYTAQWLADTDTPYLVEHYIQNITDDGYTLQTAEYRTGETNAAITLSERKMTADGITYQYGTVKGEKTETSTVSKDGKRVLKLYYMRNIYTVTTQVKNGTVSEVQYRYGEIIKEPDIPTKAGYTFSGWYRDELIKTPFAFGVTTVPAYDTVIYGKLTANTDTAYLVEHYVEQTDASYTLQNTDIFAGTTDSLVALADLVDEDLLVTGGITYKEGKVDAKEVTKVAITGDGKLVIKQYYQRESHTLAFHLNNGKEDIIHAVKYGLAINAPTGLTKTGYIFDGWDKKPAAIMANNDLTYTAQWKAKTDTPYTVKHIRQALDGTYPDSGMLVETVSSFGTTDTDTAAIAKTYEGFTSGVVAQTKIAPDGSTVAEIRYSRNSYTVTWKAEDSVYSAVSYQYGQTITQPESNPVKTGYLFYAWEGFGEGCVMQAKDISYSVRWIPATNTPYTIKYLYEDLNGEYTIEASETKYGTTNAVTTVAAIATKGFTAGPVTQAAIAADASTVLEISYSRNSYTVNWLSEGEIIETNVVKYQGAIVAPNITPEKPGYNFVGWDNAAVTMPANDTSYTAVWQGKIYTVTFVLNDGTYNEVKVNQTYRNNYVLPVMEPVCAGYAFNGWYTEPTGGTLIDENDVMQTDCDHKLYAQWEVDTNTRYTVKHYQQNVYDNEYTLVSTDTQILTGVTDANTNASARHYAGFTVQGFDQTLIKGDGSTEVQIYYIRNSYTLTFMPENGSEAAVTTVRYGKEIIPPETPVKLGYTFDGWGAVAGTMPASNVSYSAKWVANTYTLTFDGNGGNILGYNSKNVTNGDSYGTMPEALRAGYTFSGWYTAASGGNNINSETTVAIADAQTVYAHWVADNYTVTFDGNGGSISGDNNKNVTYDDRYGMMPEPIRTGYTFAGWYTAANGGKRIAETDTVSILAAQRLYAHWTANEYFVVFEGNGATSGAMEPQELIYDTDELLNVNTLLRTGYRFVGWAAVAAGEADYSDKMSICNLTSESNGTVTLYAQWKIEDYSISFDSNGGSAVDKMKNLHYGDAIITPTEPTRKGYRFVDWYSDSSLENRYQFGNMPAESFTLYAKWIAVNYTIHYELLHSGTNHTNNPASYTIETFNITLGNPTRNYYTFDGWYTDSGFSNKADGVAIAAGSTGERTFYAKWTAIRYNIEYGNLGDAQNSNPTSYTTESSFTLATPSNRSGYIFGGWYDNASLNGSATLAIASGSSGDKSFYAKWSAISYDIKYALNGGTNNSNNLSTYNIESVSISLAEPTRDGYRFDGWYTDGSFSNKVNGVAINSGSMGEKIFYAKWVAISYTLQYQTNGGTNAGNPGSYTIESPTITLTAASRIGYTFEGWFDNSSCNGNEITELCNGSTGNRTFYAKWTLNTYNIVYNLYGGTNGANPSEFTVESDTITLQNPTKGEDDVFTGWYTSSAFTGTAVTHITQGSVGNVTLFAKWINYGRFTVTNNGNNTFTITRSGGTDGAQTVSYHTQNGSAIGGTHFTGVNSSVTFAQGETAKTVSIAENSVISVYGSNNATAFSNADRVYFFDIYAVEGGGKLGSTTRATRTMAKNASYTIDAAYLNNYRQVASIGPGKQQVYEKPSGGDYNTTIDTYLGSSPVLNSTVFGGNLQTYIRQTASDMKVRLMNFTGYDDCDDVCRFVLFNTAAGNVSFNSNKNSTSIPNLPSGTKCVVTFGYCEDKKLSSYSVQLPANKYTSIANVDGYNISISDAKWASGQDTGDYVLYGFDETCRISIGAWVDGAANRSWFFTYGSLYACPKDIDEPDLIGVAPMASSTFYKGDKVVVSLVFDEIVNSANNVSLNTMLSNSAFTLTGGLGTNVLYFEGTVTNNGYGVPTTADIIINNSANIKDMCN